MSKAMVSSRKNYEGRMLLKMNKRMKKENIDSPFLFIHN